jgi:cytochrome P450
VTRPPVTDWATDFDHFDPEWVADPYPIWADLRERCPVAHTDRYHGVYLPTRHEDISAIAHDPARFSSRSVVVNDLAVEELGGFTMPPITTDPPDHNTQRRVMLPAFSPRATEQWRPVTRQICLDLLDRFAGTGACDGSDDYAKHVPVLVIARMIGIPESDADRFRQWVHDLLEVGPFDIDVARRVTREMFDYFDVVIEEHRARPQEDLTSFLLAAQMDGEPLDDRQISGGLYLLLLAGIDTTWNTIGAALWHLARNPADRRRLATDPAVMDMAVEEFLRYYAPVSVARIITEEVELAGTTLCPGQRVLLPFPAGNRDPEFLPDAEDFVIDRQVNRHSAFGLGIHRCLGSNLARMEIKVALEEWMARIPEFELVDADAVTWSPGQLRGPRRLPLRW